jgi:hypothetical protein
MMLITIIKNIKFFLSNIFIWNRMRGHPSVNKINGVNIYSHIKKLNLSLFFPEQRQKLSIAATQCGVLTSFSPDSPPLISYN